MPRLSSATETWHLRNSALYTNDITSSAVLVTPVNSGVFRHQLHGLDAPTLDPSTDTYIWVKAVCEWPELIVQGAASGGNRAYTGQLATMARQLYRALLQPQQQVLDNAQASASQLQTG
jgi:hypothetical protein